MIRNAVDVLFKNAEPVEKVVKFKETCEDEFSGQWEKTESDSNDWDLTLRLKKQGKIQYYFCSDSDGTWRFYRGERE